MFKKSLIASAVVLATVQAQAAVDLTSATPTVPVFATEIAVDATNGTSLTNAGNAIDVVVDYGFAANANTIRYLRFDLSSGAEFGAAPSLACIGADNGSDNQTATVSSGGNGASFVIFELVDTDDAIASDGECTLAAATYDVTGQTGVTLTYGHYETAGTAVSKTGALATDSGSIISFGAALDVDFDAVTPAKIDVTQASKYFNGGTADDETVIGDVNIDVDGTTLWTDGLAAALTDIVGAGTALDVTGVFTAAQNDDGTYTGAALSRVFIDNDGGCDNVNTAASALSATEASFTLNTTAVADAAEVCFMVEGTPVIEKTSFTANYDVTVAGATSDATDVSVGTISTLTKNGSSADVELVLTPGGAFNNYIRISNTSAIAGDVFVTVWNDSGDSVQINLGDVAGVSSSTIAAGASTGVIPTSAVYNAAVAADATFDVAGGKLRLDVEGEFSSIDVQNITLSTDNTTFATF